MDTRLPVQRISLDTSGGIVGNRRRGGAVRLACRLVLEARQELATESVPGIAREYLRPCLRRELLRSPSNYFPIYLSTRSPLLDMPPRAMTGQRQRVRSPAPQQRWRQPLPSSDSSARQPRWRTTRRGSSAARLQRRSQRASCLDTNPQPDDIQPSHSTTKTGIFLVVSDCNSM